MIAAKSLNRDTSQWPRLAIIVFLMKVVISVIYQISQFILLFHMFDLLKIISHYTYTYTQIAHSLLSYLRLK